MDRGSANSLAPGFRFHPTDEELVCYYLKRKILHRPCFDAISVVDIYKSEPWDLPDKSKLKSRDLEWYFFSALDKKYGNGSRTNRATDRGYWKTTGKDREIFHKRRVVGMKKTLVYHIGRPKDGERSNWVMHEYRITDDDFVKGRNQQEIFVMCKIFQKSGSGAKHGEQYGAPFIDEEWKSESDEEIFLPVQPAVAVNEESVNVDASIGTDTVSPADNNYFLHELLPELADCPPADDVLMTDLSNLIDPEIVGTDTVNPADNNYFLHESWPEVVDCPPADKVLMIDLSNLIDLESVGTDTVNLVDNNYFLHEPWPEVGEVGDCPPDVEVFMNDLSNLIDQESVGTDTVNPANNNYFLPEPWPEVSDCTSASDGILLTDLSNLIDPESVGTNTTNPADNNYFLHELRSEVADCPATDGIFLSDLSESEFFDPGDFLTFDAVDDQSPALAFGSDELMGLNGATEQATNAIKPVDCFHASSSQQELKLNLIPSIYLLSTTVTYWAAFLLLHLPLSCPRKMWLSS